MYDFFSTIFNRNAALYGGPEGHGCPGFGDDDRGPSAVPDWTNLLGLGRALPPFVGICFLCIYVFPHAVAQLGKTGTGKRLVFYPYGGRLPVGFPCAAPFGKTGSSISISVAPTAGPGSGRPAEREKSRFAAVGAAKNFIRKPEKSRFPFYTQRKPAFLNFPAGNAPVCCSFPRRNGIILLYVPSRGQKVN